MQAHVQGPVFLRDEGRDLLFAVADDAQRDGLDTPGGKPALDLIPQKGRDPVAHDAVEHTPCLLGIHQMHVDLARVF